MKFTHKSHLGTRVEFTSGSRKGIQAVVSRVCARHQYYIVTVTKGNREFRKGEDLHTGYHYEVKVLES